MNEDEAFSSTQILKGHLELLVLATVKSEPTHGYGIIERLRLRSGGGFNLSDGTVYPVLHRLEEAGLLASRWSDEHPRRRRVYSLTERGWDTLQRGSRAWREFADNIALVLFGQKRDEWI